MQCKMKSPTESQQLTIFIQSFGIISKAFIEKRCVISLRQFSEEEKKTENFKTKLLEKFAREDGKKTHQNNMCNRYILYDT